MHRWIKAIEKIKANNWNFMVEGTIMTLPDGPEFMYWAEVCLNEEDICGSTSPHFDEGDALTAAIEDLENVLDDIKRGIYSHS